MLWDQSTKVLDLVPSTLLLHDAHRTELDQVRRGLASEEIEAAHDSREVASVRSPDPLCKDESERFVKRQIDR